MFLLATKIFRNGYIIITGKLELEYSKNISDTKLRNEMFVFLKILVNVRIPNLPILTKRGHQILK